MKVWAICWLWWDYIEKSDWKLRCLLMYESCEGYVESQPLIWEYNHWDTCEPFFPQVEAKWEISAVSFCPLHDGSIVNFWGVKPHEILLNLQNIQGYEVTLMWRKLILSGNFICSK